MGERKEEEGRGKGSERETERGRERLQAGGKRKLPVYRNHDTMKMLTRIIKVVVASFRFVLAKRHF